MKKEQNEYIKFTKSRRKYNSHQIAKGVGLGISLAGFGAAMKGAFNNIDLSNIEYTAKNAGTKALDFYKELASKCNPGSNVPAYVFLGLAGGFIVLIIRGKILKRKLTNATVSDLTISNATLTDANNTLTENNSALQKTITESHKRVTPKAPNVNA